MSNNTENGWRSFEDPKTGWVGMNYIPNILHELCHTPESREMTRVVIKRLLKEMEEKENENNN